MNSIKIILIILSIIFIAIAGYFFINKKTLPPVSPLLQQETINKPSSPAPASLPPTPSYNPPKEVKYDSSTDLNQELESINPQVLDKDFEGL